jgi:hypothetical protein
MLGGKGKIMFNFKISPSANIFLENKYFKNRGILLYAFVLILKHKLFIRD